MAAPFILIDGYNLMHAVGLFQRSFAAGEFEKRRNRFLQYLVEGFSAAERPRVTVVFDGTEGGNRQIAQHLHENMTVIFSAAGTHADDVLEDLIAAHSAPRQILLVSSDHRLQKAARKRRGRFVDSEVFAERLERRAERESQPKRNTGPPAEKLSGLSSQVELDHWLNEFGELPAEETTKQPAEFDVDALQREIDAESGGADP